MTDSDRSQFDQALDALARILRLTALDTEAKFGYFKALKNNSLVGFIDGINKLTQTYRPRRKDDFPVPAVISEAITGAVNAGPGDPQESSTYEEIKASYRRRGITIGEEARERLEAEREARRQEADESWTAVEQEPVLGKEPF